MIAITFSCLRDLEPVKRLNKQLESANIKHFIYVEEYEYQDFSKHLTCYSRGTNENGTNGFGGAGARAKLNMYKLAMNHLENGECLLDLDSDVSFNNVSALFAMNCYGNEMKGYYDFKDPIHKVDGKFFTYFTGCCKSYGYDIFKRLVSATDIEEHIMKMVDNGLTPSEDAFFSYYCQNVIGAKPINLYFVFKHGKQTKQYDNKEWDLVS